MNLHICLYKSEKKIKLRFVKRKCEIFQNTPNRQCSISGIYPIYKKQYIDYSINLTYPLSLCTLNRNSVHNVNCVFGRCFQNYKSAILCVSPASFTALTIYFPASCLHTVSEYQKNSEN